MAFTLKVLRDFTPYQKPDSISRDAYM